MTMTCDCRDGICEFPAQCYEWRGVPGPVKTRTGIVIGSRWVGAPPVFDQGVSADAIQSRLLTPSVAIYDDTARFNPRQVPVTPFWRFVDRACWWLVCAFLAAAVGSCVFGFPYAPL